VLNSIGATAQLKSRALYVEPLTMPEWPFIEWVSWKTCDKPNFTCTYWPGL